MTLHFRELWKSIPLFVGKRKEKLCQKKIFLGAEFPIANDWLEMLHFFVKCRKELRSKSAEKKPRKELRNSPLKDEWQNHYGKDTKVAPVSVICVMFSRGILLLLQLRSRLHGCQTERWVNWQFEQKKKISDTHLCLPPSIIWSTSCSIQQWCPWNSSWQIYIQGFYPFIAEEIESCVFQIPDGAAYPGHWRGQPSKHRQKIWIFGC